MPKRIYVGKSNDQIKQLEQDISQLRKEVESATGSNKQVIEEKINELKEKIESIKKPFGN